LLFEVRKKAARAAIKPSGAVLPGLVRGIGTAPDRLRAADEGRKEFSRDAYHADEQEPVRIEVPHVRDDSFEPQIIPKHARRFTGFDDKVIAMYARGMTVREIQGFLAEIHGTEVAPPPNSSARSPTRWRPRSRRGRAGHWNRCIRWSSFDALRVKIRDDATVRNKAVYLALGVLPDGTRDVLGMRIEQTEGAKL
jgi:transposase-like protein